MKEKLQSIKQGDTNVYNHLVQVLRQIILNNDRDGYQQFEYYSANAKHHHHPQDHFRNEESLALGEYGKKIKGLLNKPNTGTEEEPAEPGPCGYVANLLEEAKWFEKAGVGFGQEGTYLIFKSLERFSIVKQAKELKFWGKIIGTERDYYIAEGTSQGGEQGELPADVQPKGTGVNKMTYWVTNDLISGDWKELPIVTPDQINVARRVKYAFTGDLERSVYTNPHIKGKEKHLLKCQIVRISYSSLIVPRTMFNVNAEDKKEIEAAPEDWKLPGFSFLSSLENWVHHPQNILKNGRFTLLKPTIPEGVQVDQDKLMKELQAKDPLEDRLKSISKDIYNGDKKAWAIKSIGDTNEYRALTKNKQYVNYGYIVIKSLVWKGWTLVYHNKQWSTLYVGSGSKSTSEWYFPKEPEVVFEQNKDRNEQPEPNFPPEEKKAQEPEAEPKAEE